MGGDAAVGRDVLPELDLDAGPRIARQIHELIRSGLVRAAHDPSEGGLLPALAEMAFAGGLGMELDLSKLPICGNASVEARAFAEDPARYVLEIDPARLDEVGAILAETPHAVIGTVDAGSEVVVRDGSTELARMQIEDLRREWQEAIEQ